MFENNEFGLKELYELTLKATYPIEIEGRVFEVGEVIARFDRIQIANFKEITNRVGATGGYDNRAQVVWEDPKEIQLSFSQGIFSKKQFALLNNSKLLKASDREIIKISEHFSGESDKDGRIKIGKEQISEVFIYNAKNYEKIKPISINSLAGEIVINQPYLDVEIDYNYNYNNGFSSAVIGQKLTNGYLELEGKTRIKDDITGKVRTAILKIPRLKLISDLSMRLGREAGPIMANFNAVGLPMGVRGSKKIMELVFLNDDIDAEM